VLGPGLTPLEVWDLCKEMRRHLDAPLLVFMDNDGVDCMALALDAGADVCLPGKVDTASRLILSAVAAIARREQLARRSSNGIVEAGHLRIDLYRKTVELNGELVPLTATEFGILSILAQQPGCVISAGEIVRRVHGYEAVEGEAQDIVKVHISRLRQKLGEDQSSARCIANVRGQGYMYTFERRTEPRSIGGVAREDARETILATALARGAS
jgi:two-component system response regulator RegX3